MTSQECVAEIKYALKMFGEYTYNDKGPHEVMDMGSFISKFKALPALETKKILLEVLELDQQFGEKFVSAVLVDMQDVPDEYWEELMTSEKLERAV